MTSVEDQTRGVIDEFIQRLMEEARKMERGEVPILTGPMALRKFATDLLMAKEELVSVAIVDATSAVKEGRSNGGHLAMRFRILCRPTPAHMHCLVFAITEEVDGGD